MTGRLAALFAPIVNAAKLAAWPVGSIYMSIHRWQCSPQQHAAVAGRGPLEARGIRQAVRKGAAV